MGTRVKAKNRGFTLIELLVALAVIAILAGLIYSAAGSVLSASRNAQSVSNLRGLAQAARAFGADNDNRLPPIAGLYFKDWQGKTGKFGRLDAYGIDKIRVDPALPKGLIGYGMNLQLAPLTTSTPVRDHGKGNWGSGGSAGAQPRWGDAPNSRSCYTWMDIEQPAKTILYAVTPENSNGSHSFAFYYANPKSLAQHWTPKNLAPADRHVKGKVQCVMADGSAQLLDLAELTAEGAQTSIYWGLKK